MTMHVPISAAGTATGTASTAADDQPTELEILAALERKVLWLSSWMIHNANHLRESRDGLKVGGHQSSCASAATLMTALFFKTLTARDHIAVKPHASPVFHAIQYMLGRQSLDKLQRFRALGGAQAYPSRTKDTDGVDFSTGSVGLGVGITLFASIVADYLAARRPDMETGRMVAVMGDAELDEGNVFEALLEGWKHDVRNLWWVIDYNRHSLDGTVNDHLFNKITSFFETVGWEVVALKYGKALTDAFAGPAGEALKRWIDDCPNQLYSALTFKGGSGEAAVWRQHLKRDLAGTSGIGEFLDSRSDPELHALLTNLGGHDMATLTEAFEAAKGEAPRCFIAYTIKGYGLPLAGHRDNHAGLMTEKQVAALRQAWGIAEGQEWDRFAGLETGRVVLETFLEQVAWRDKPLESHRRPTVIKGAMPQPASGRISTQAAFGTLLAEIAKQDDALRHRLVTTSPDVAVSTNLAGFINRRGVFNRSDRKDTFRDEHVASPLKWTQGPAGQHIELGIAENNLFLMLAALGLAEPLFGERLLPIGTVYDPFVNRGLDALIYACYQDARFMLAGTPSGITLAPEGGAHQSINTPLVGMSVPGLASYEPAFADELGVLVEWGLQHMQRRDGGAVYLRLSTRAVEQRVRSMTGQLASDIVAGGYWLVEPAQDAALAVVYSGALAPEAIEAHGVLSAAHPGTGLLAVTSADRLHEEWIENGSDCHAAQLLARMAGRAGLVTVIDGHPATLSWLGAVRGDRIRPLGVTRFGQSADLPDLYKAHGIDADAIVAAAEQLATMGGG